MPSARAWRLSDAGLAEAGPAERPLVAVPSEQVLLTVVDLPLPTHRRRLEALPFAIEERVAEPIESLHVALGEAVAPGRYLAAAVGHATMAAWIAEAEAADLDAASLVPDALLIARPPEGRWSARIEGMRALVRTDDGAGFALRTDQFAAAWVAGGRPPVQVLEGQLPEGVAAVADVAVGTLVAAIPLDLRQGRYAVRRRSSASLWRRAGWIAAAGIAAHGAIAAADTLMLRSMAQQNENEVRALVARAVPLPPDADVVSRATERLAGVAGPGAVDPLLPIAARAATALQAGGLQVRGMGFDGRGLVIGVPPGDEARVAALLAGAGLTAVAGDGQVRVTGGGR